MEQVGQADCDDPYRVPTSRHYGGMRVKSMLSAFRIAGEIIMVIAVSLCVYSRKISHMPLQGDDCTLIIAMFSSVTAVILFDVRGIPIHGARSFIRMRKNELDVQRARLIGHSLSLYVHSRVTYILYSNWGMGRH